MKNQPELLLHFEADANDRTYQFWKRRALSIELRTDNAYLQKLNYIHNNPVKGGICKLPEEYNYLSALFFQTAADNWRFLITVIESQSGGGWKKNTRQGVKKS